MKSSSNGDFTTSNFYLAVFLLAQGFELLGISNLDPRRSFFIFAGTADIDSSANCFLCAKENTSEAKIDARLMVAAIRKLKDLLYQSRRVCRES